MVHSFLILFLVFSGTAHASTMAKNSTYWIDDVLDFFTPRSDGNGWHRFKQLTNQAVDYGIVAFTKIIEPFLDRPTVNVTTPEIEQEKNRSRRTADLFQDKLHELQPSDVVESRPYGRTSNESSIMPLLELSLDGEAIFSNSSQMNFVVLKILVTCFMCVLVVRISLVSGLFDF